jgi:hypothetical protein
MINSVPIVWPYAANTLIPAKNNIYPRSPLLSLIPWLKEKENNIDIKQVISTAIKSISGISVPGGTSSNSLEWQVLDISNY